jgi:hypothetical protein
LRSPLLHSPPQISRQQRQCPCHRTLQPTQHLWWMPWW